MRNGETRDMLMEAEGRRMRRKREKKGDCSRKTSEAVRVGGAKS